MKQDSFNHVLAREFAFSVLSVSLIIIIQNLLLIFNVSSSVFLLMLALLIPDYMLDFY